METAYFFNLDSFQYKDLFEAISYPWLALLKLEAFIRNLPLGIHQGVISSSAYLIDPEFISIGEGSVIEPGAYIKGPCVIGKNCTIRHGAYLRGNVLTGNQCVIGHASELKNTVMMNHSNAPHFAYLGDSILGSNVNLGAGVRCANFRLDGKPILLNFESVAPAKNWPEGNLQPARFPFLAETADFGSEPSIDTEMRKLGAIIGDGTQLGCNVVTNPGSLIGQGVKCYPCLNIGGFIPSRSFLKS